MTRAAGDPHASPRSPTQQGCDPFRDLHARATLAAELDQLLQLHTHELLTGFALARVAEGVATDLDVGVREDARLCDGGVSGKDFLREGSELGVAFEGQSPCLVEGERGWRKTLREDSGGEREQCDRGRAELKKTL